MENVEGAGDALDATVAAADAPLTDEQIKQAEYVRGFEVQLAEAQAHIDGCAAKIEKEKGRVAEAEAALEKAKAEHEALAAKLAEARAA